MGKSIPDVGKQIEVDIKKRTRLGYGVPENESSKESLAKLSDSYIKQRKRLKKGGGLSNETSPSKSNLTKTGSMLNSLKTTTNSSKLTVTVKPEGSDGDGVSNTKKAKWAQDGSSNRLKRPFLYLSSPEIKRITEFLRKELDKVINKLF